MHAHSEPDLFSPLINHNPRCERKIMRILMKAEIIPNSRDIIRVLKQRFTPHDETPPEQ